ncbi:MAG: GHMP kinase [Planctomycetaceae bacterium]|nr:GHMP kinase [Planctomycetaceae bacterium]
MIIHTQAFARAGLIGNPSDGYFGKCISIIVRNYAAQVTCWESPTLRIVPQVSDRLEFRSLKDLTNDVQLHGHYGGIRLIKASIKRFHAHCMHTGIDLPDRNFTIEYQTNIPIRVGLAGSSGIITATMRALMQFYDVDIPQPILPNLILSVEVDELGIAAGLQDRVIQVYQGAVFMDLGKDFMDQHAHGQYQPLKTANLPPLFVAYHDNLSEGTEVAHNDLRSRYNRGDAAVRDAMVQFADYAQQARDHIEAGRGADIAPLMDANFDLRASICPISDGNRQLVDTGRQLGAAVKFAGSGGAVIGAYDGDPDRLRRLTDAYAAFGAHLIVPDVD